MELARRPGMAPLDPDETIDLGPDELPLPLATCVEQPLPTSRVGRVLAGRYRVDALIGAGATGLVYRAHRLDAGDDVAVKLLNPRHAGNAAMHARLRREAIATGRIEHPNVVRFHELAVDDADGSLLFAMELLEGRSLGSCLERGGPLGVERSLDLAAQLCAALSAAHAVGVVHRDVKPENVMVEPHLASDGILEERVRLFDFGIAQVAAGDDAPAELDRLTQAGAIWGTPRYMAPEQARGARIDARADVYATGVVLYELLTGRTPFEASTPFDMLTQHVFLDPQPPSAHDGEIDPRIDTLVLRALGKEPIERQQSAAELRDEILDVLARWSHPPAAGPRPADVEWPILHAA